MCEYDVAVKVWLVETVLPAWVTWSVSLSVISPLWLPLDVPETADAEFETLSVSPSLI